MLGGVNGRLVNPAEMYKNEIAVLTEELARVKKELDEERDLRKRVEKNADERSKAARQFETELAKLRESLAKRELEQAELKKDLNEERNLRKQVEKNADERSKAARQDLETELADLRNSLTRRELEQAELKKGVDEEMQIPKQLETDANELPISILRTDGPDMSPKGKNPSIPDGKYVIKNRARDIFWNPQFNPIRTVYFKSTTMQYAKNNKFMQVNNHKFLIIQVFQRLNLFRSGISHKMPMVTSPWLGMVHLRGLVSKLLGLQCQFRGDSSGKY